MSYSEDVLNEVFEEVRELGIRIEFDLQLAKMKLQDKHKFKRSYEKWEYALYRVKGGPSQGKY
mgnify:CR=1 FL=1|tara:strand:- start:922 stop:1110 length:189 start_codon:yes stop_codon:yes gene_type:complete